MGLTTNFWKKKRVLITGHTGFKGSWLCLWLQSLGANIQGVALPPSSKPSLFSLAGVKELIKHDIVDIREISQVKKIFNQFKPEIIFHLAAQPIVIESYKTPWETYETNIMGTLNIFEAARNCKSVKVILNVTSDKCYNRNDEPKNFNEKDSLGGEDPYSSSKACSEIISHAYRSSFLSDSDIHLATARAGNVIGGGDWAQDRLIPDTLKSLELNKGVILRYPNAVRPWQHVLEPLSGYLLLAQKLYLHKKEFAESWNFGPNENEDYTVSQVVENIYKIWGTNVKWINDQKKQLHEDRFLKLDITKAKTRLKWFPQLSIIQALTYLVEWHKSFLNNENLRSKTLEQINDYSKLIN